MPLLIGEKKLIPAPLVNINKQMVLNDDGSPLSQVYRIVAQGTLLPNKGSPTSLGFYIGEGEPSDESFTTDDEKFNAITSKQEYLKELVACTGNRVVYGAAGYQPIEFYPLPGNVSFEPGPWVILSNYSIEWEAPFINKSETSDDEKAYVSGTYGLGLRSVADDYSIREKDDGSRILEITRTTSATARTNYYASGIMLGSGISVAESWRNAQFWVTNRINNVPFASGLSSQFNISPTGTSYNYVREETINQFAGSYSLSQRYIYHTGNSFDNRTVTRSITRNKSGNGGPTVTVITVNGTITGLSPTGNSPSGKYANALAYWQSISGGLGVVVGAYGYDSNTTTTEDQINGTLGYNVVFINNSGTTYKHDYNVTYTLPDDNYATATINGTIEGITNDDFWNSASGQNKFNYAVSGWGALSGSLRTLTLAYLNQFDFAGDYDVTPQTTTVNFDKPNGIVNYSQTFHYTLNGDEVYNHTYNINFETSNAPPDIVTTNQGGLLVTATIDGVIKGLMGIDPTTRIVNAKTGWDAVQGTLLGIVNAEYGLIGANKPALASGYVRRTVSDNPQAGIITYNCVFNNYPRPSSTQVAVQEVQISDNYPHDIFAVHIIPGRSQGPIKQNIGTVNESTKTINIALTMYPKGSLPYYWLESDKSTPAGIASGVIGSIVSSIGTRGTNYFLSSDNDQWDARNGFYTRTMTIVY